MALNLAALATLAGALLLAAFLLRRYLPRAEAAHAAKNANACLRCRTPAASLTSFTCPGCGHDVRETGLGPPRGRSPLVPFFTVVVFTCAYLVAAAVVSGILQGMIPRVHHVSRTVSMRLSSPQIQDVDLHLDARGPREDQLRGKVYGDLYATGGIVTLEVNLPERNWRLLDAAGAQVDAGDVLDWQVVHRWMERAGVPVDSATRLSDAAHVAAEVGRLAGTRIDMPPVAGIGPALSLSYSSSTGGNSSNVPDERSFPLIIIGGTLLYLGGLWLVLAGLTAAPGPVAPVAAPAVTSEGES